MSRIWHHKKTYKKYIFLSFGVNWQTNNLYVFVYLRLTIPYQQCPYIFLKIIMKEGLVLLITLLCIISPINSTNKFNCHGHQGVQPDPENCQCFYICNFNEAVHECCNREELFDAKFLVCNHDYLVDCDVRPHPGESTTKVPIIYFFRWQISIKTWTRT